MKHFLWTLLVCVSVLGFAADAVAYDYRFFSISDNLGSYKVLPGDSVELVFNMLNRNILHPRNVTVFVKDCPITWKCERKILSYEADGVHAESLLVTVPVDAVPKRYVMYILLESDWPTDRGHDRVEFTVLSAEQTRIMTYEEYLEKEDERKAAEVERIKAIDTYVPPSRAGIGPASVAGAEDVVVSGGESEVISVIAGVDEVPDRNTRAGVERKAAEIVENMGSLENSRQFIEYASVVLVAMLVFIAIGVFVAFKGDKK